jgi:hypothetical protein
VPPSLEDLIKISNQFFALHWNGELIGYNPPNWSERYTFKGSLPNYDKQGVYAFVTDDSEITYIGVGTSKGSGLYRGHGLGIRFNRYKKVINGVHTPIDNKLTEAGGMVTIGFNQDQAYLANALELYLLGRLETKYNRNRPGS